jgi:hypothetical protein
MLVARPGLKLWNTSMGRSLQGKNRGYFSRNEKYLEHDPQSASPMACGLRRISINTIERIVTQLLDICGYDHEDLVIESKAKDRICIKKGTQNQDRAFDVRISNSGRLH